MPVQMIELDEVQIVEASDENLEMAGAMHVQGGLFSGPPNTNIYAFKCSC
jgi:hypothetical protein